MSFLSIFNQYPWEEISNRLNSVTSKEVCDSINKNHRDIWDFLNLVSKPASAYLEEMARISREITLQRFGKIIQLYIPMYLSNECTNICTYCGFSVNNQTPRITLTPKKIEQEAIALKKKGFEHILILTGEAPQKVNLAYFKEALKILNRYFSYISLEIQPLETKEYLELIPWGLDGVVVYQESYRQSTYKKYHPKGKKSHFNYRIESPDRLGKAQIRKIGLGVLLGLENWKIESFFTALHLNYLKKRYWKSNYSISFPRIRPAEGIIDPNYPISDRELVQLIAAWRLYDQDVELHLSTRETSSFRDNVFHLGITSMSAGSKTSPGGYSCFADQKELEQFEISDERELKEVAAMLKNKGYEPVTKDWDKSFH